MRVTRLINNIFLLGENFNKLVFCMENKQDNKINNVEKKQDNAAPASFWHQVKELFSTIIIGGLIILVLRIFLFEPCNIPSGSMIPTLQIGDYIFVSKYSYGYSRYSLPLYHPDIKGRIWYKAPERGDVAVFRSTKPPYDYYVKRIIGLPGDTIQVRDSVLYINGKAVERLLKGNYQYHENAYDPEQVHYLYTEALPSNNKIVKHEILQKIVSDYEQEPYLSNGELNVNNTIIYKVPDGHFFAMGDNREHSADSRFIDRNSPDYLGYVPIDHLIGKVQFVFYSYDAFHPVWQFWYWPIEIRWNRLFKVIK